jgi:hypothetical protein
MNAVELEEIRLASKNVREMGGMAPELSDLVDALHAHIDEQAKRIAELEGQV